MVNLQTLNRFFIRPLQTIKLLLQDKKLNWTYPILIYGISIMFAIVMMIILKIFNSENNVLATFYYAPLITLPFVLIITLTGVIFFKEFENNIFSQLYASILIVSFSFIILLSMFICAIGLDKVGLPLSPMFVVAIYFMFISISRLRFNLITYIAPKKKIWFKSLIEILLIIVFSVIIIGGIATILNTPKQHV